MARVLVVDDSLLVRTQLRRVLESAGHEVVAERASADDVVAVVRELAPDVVLLDLVMPGRSSLAAIGHLAKAATGTRVVVCSASADAHHVVQAVALGAYDFVAKPVDAERVLRAVSGALAAA